jgi:large subunit ribosomal protein L3
MKFIIGTKVGMTQVFDTAGVVHPVTVIAVVPNAVTQVKTAEKDGYSAVQVGYGSRKEKNVNKAQRAKGNFAGFKEFSAEGGPASGWQVGTVIEPTIFTEGDTVQVSAISKGKGFQGVVKRYNFKGGPRSHGQKHSERERGSSGGGPGRAGGRVALGMRMAGRVGGERVTVKNLSIVGVDADKKELYIEGAVPGRRGTYVEVVSK